MFACAAAVVYDWRTNAEHVVVAVSPRELRVDLRSSGRPVQRGRERIDPARVRCVVRADSVCESDGQCEESFDVQRMLGTRSLVPTNTYDSAGEARGKCAALAAFGIRTEERR